MKTGLRDGSWRGTVVRYNNLALLVLITRCFGQTTAEEKSAPIVTSVQQRSIEGHVTDFTTNLPVADMPVILTQMPGMVQYTTKTDNFGRYLFRGPYDGLVSVHVERQRGYLRAGKRIQIDSEATIRFDIQLKKAGLLTGRVINANKEPIAGAVVQVRREGYRFGRPTLLTSFTRTTNDIGEYRFSELDPGEYVIQAIPKILQFETPGGDKADLSGRAPEVTDATTYYVHSPDRAGATKVSVPAGGIETRADLSIIRSASVCIASKPELPFGMALDQIGVVLGEPYAMSQSRIAVGRVPSAGILQVCGIPPGTYSLRAVTNTPSGEILLGVLSFAVSGSRPAQLPPLRLSTLTTVTGTIAVEDRDGTTLKEAPGDIQKVTVALYPKDRIPYAGEGASAPVTSPGVFSLRAFYDEYWVRVDGVPSDYFVKSVSCNLMDVFRNPFMAGKGALNVLLGNYAATVTGTTTDSSGRTSDGVTVLLLHANAGRDELIAPNELFHTVSDARGHFRIVGVPPGDYFLAGYDKMPYGQEYSTETRRAVQSSHVRIRLSAGEQHSVTVRTGSLPQ